MAAVVVEIIHLSLCTGIDHQVIHNLTSSYIHLYIHVYQLWISFNPSELFSSSHCDRSSFRVAALAARQPVSFAKSDAAAARRTAAKTGKVAPAPAPEAILEVVIVAWPWMFYEHVCYVFTFFRFEIDSGFT